MDVLVLCVMMIFAEGMDIECIFKMLNNDSLQIITKFHHIDYERILEEDKYLNLIFGEGKMSIIISMISSYEPFDFPTRGCVQVFDELCEPIETLLQRFRQTYSSYWICTCNRGVLRLESGD